MHAMLEELREREPDWQAVMSDVAAAVDALTVTYPKRRQVAGVGMAAVALIVTIFSENWWT